MAHALRVQPSAHAVPRPPGSIHCQAVQCWTCCMTRARPNIRLCAPHNHVRSCHALCAKPCQLEEPYSFVWCWSMPWSARPWLLSGECAGAHCTLMQHLFSEPAYCCQPYQHHIWHMMHGDTWHGMHIMSNSCSLPHSLLVLNQTCSESHAAPNMPASHGPLVKPLNILVCCFEEFNDCSRMKPGLPLPCPDT